MNSAVYQWAIRHNVNVQALNELKSLFGMHGGHAIPQGVSGRSEAAVQTVVRLEAANKGLHLFRNNVGVLTDETGRPVRYGLGNESQRLNKIIKSADLIGWRPLVVGPEHVGQQVAIFVSRECKAVGWRYADNEHERAQLAWAQLVTASGGDGAFCTGEGTL